MRVYFDGAPDGAVVSRVTARIRREMYSPWRDAYPPWMKRRITIHLFSRYRRRYIFALVPVDMPSGWPARGKPRGAEPIQAAPRAGGYIRTMLCCVCRRGKAGGSQACRARCVRREQQKQGNIRVCTADGRVRLPSTRKIPLTGQRGGVEPGRWCVCHLFRLHQRGIHRSAQLLSLEVTARKDANKSAPCSVRCVP